jgi:hypothetical protein
MKSLKLTATAVALFGAAAVFASQPALANNNQLSIDKVISTFGAVDSVCGVGETDYITITGVNLVNVKPASKKNPTPVVTLPVVTLGNDPIPLELCGTPTATTIVAVLPPDLEDGDYKLKVVTGKSEQQRDDWDLTIGAGGSAGSAGISGYEQVEVERQLDAGGSGLLIAPCSAGRKVLGGSVRYAIGVALGTSFPSSDSGSWTCLFLNQDSLNQITVKCYAICANASP